MNTERAFLDDIIASPEDDAPRLIFADWLEDHGDPDRAEFIRLQVELEKLPPHSVRARQARAREAGRARRCGDSWRGRLREITSQAAFRRGFVEIVQLTARQLAD